VRRLLTTLSAALQAEVYIKGKPNDLNDTPSDKDQIIMTDAEGEQETLPVRCLFCDSVIDEKD